MGSLPSRPIEGGQTSQAKTKLVDLDVAVAECRTSRRHVEFRLELVSESLSLTDACYISLSSIYTGTTPLFYVRELIVDL